MAASIGVVALALAGCGSSAPHKPAHRPGPLGCLQGYNVTVKGTGGGDYNLSTGESVVSFGHIASFKAPAEAESFGRQQGAKWWRYGTRLVTFDNGDPGGLLGISIHACYGDRPDATG